VIAMTGTAWAQDAMKVVTADTPLKWVDSAALPKGAQVAVMIGDPTKSEMIATRVKFPTNYFAPPHTHPFAESITVISGSLGHGMGDKVDKASEMLKPGTFIAVPAKHPHYVWTGPEETIIQVQYIGPSGLDYVNPADDPRKK
jgi:quercetin dioxygenase-like cupin family protein